MKGIYRKLAVTLLIVIFSINIANLNITKIEAKQIYFSISAFDRWGTSPKIDYFCMIKDQLLKIGIDLNVYTSPWITPESPIPLRNYDLFFDIQLGHFDDPSEFASNYLIEDDFPTYDITGNICGYDPTLDFNETLGMGLNEWYITQGEIFPLNDAKARIEHYWEWQNYLMDKILPCKPFFCSSSYSAYWNNLLGYNFSKGLLQSWGNMIWEGAHSNQENSSEVVIADTWWKNLNPLYQDDSASQFITNAILEPLFWKDSDNSIWPHLAESYQLINQTHIRIKCREGIKWQADPEGYFPNEYFNAKDVYFTLFIWKYLSNDQFSFDWLKSISIIDEYTIDLFIDGNPSTSEQEPFGPLFTKLAIPILPEHYLNQTQLGDGVTPNILHPNWNIFASHCFGTGMFQIESFDKYIETILSLNNDFWGKNSTLTDDTYLNWYQRFGDFSSELKTLRIKNIPESILQLANFQHGLIDIVDITNEPEKREEFLQTLSISIQKSKRDYYSQLIFNLRTLRDIIGSRELCEADKTITKGLAIRKALSYAINVDEINEVIHANNYLLTYYPIPSNLGIWCNDEINKYDYDLFQAQYYLALAGYGEFPTSSTSTSSIKMPILVIEGILIFSTIKFKLNKKMKS